MKKTLIALAALAATGAFAQSTVSIDGIMDAGYQNINYKGTSVSDVAGNGSSTSQINFRGSEDLGGGLKAEFRVETDWNIVSSQANTGTASSVAPTAPAVAYNSTAGTFGNGEVRVGVAGGFGRVDMGVVNFNTLSTYGVGQPYGTAIGGGYKGVYVNDSTGAAVRAENAIKYVSPSFAGFNVSLYNVTKNTQATKGDYSSTIGAYDHQGVQEIGLNYSNGPLNVSYSQLAQDFDGVQAAGGAAVVAANYKTTVRTLGANYDFGKGIKAFFLSQQVGADTAGKADRNFSSIAGSYTMGNNVFTALIGSGTNGLNAGKTSTMSSVGYDYNLSKRTAVYARYERIGDDGGFIAAATTLDGQDTARTRTAVGLRHAF